MVNTVRSPARARRKRRKRAAVIPVLPDELIQWEILVRLPAKELLRCGATCRTWSLLTSTAAFLLAHHRRQPSLPLVSFNARFDSSDSYDFHTAVDALDLRRSPGVRRPVLGFHDKKYDLRRDFTIHASCDGLLILSLSNNCFYLCNPATRQWCDIPDLIGGKVAALYPHGPSGEYRVLYWKDPNGNGSAVYYVVSLGSSQAPRCITLPMTSPSMMPVLIFNAGKHPPVLLHNCLHWHSDGEVTIFDTVVESFRWMQSSRAADSSANLLEIDGKLGITHIDDATTEVKLWVLQNYDMEVWSLKHQIELPLEMRRVREDCDHFGWTLVLENLDVLQKFQCDLFHCYGEGKLVKKFRCEGLIPNFSALCFRESLVRHEFFQRRDGRRVGKEARFFQGLQGNIGDRP